MLTVSFDKVLSELTYGNLVMTCLHTVISSAFHPYFLGLTIVPIMSVIVNVLHSLLCSNDRHMVVICQGCLKRKQFFFKSLLGSNLTRG